MIRKICKFVLRNCAKCAIFAVLLILMSACSANKKVVERQSRLEMSADSVVTAQHTQASHSVAQSAASSDSTTTQVRASATIDIADSVLVVRVTDYDSVTGLPLRTVETENRSTLQHTIANADYLQQIAHYEQQMQTMQRSFDSLLVSMRQWQNIALRDSSALHEEREPAVTVTGLSALVEKLSNLVLMLVIFAMIYFAWKQFRRQ